MKAIIQKVLSASVTGTFEMDVFELAIEITVFNLYNRVLHKYCRWLNKAEVLLNLNQH